METMDLCLGIDLGTTNSCISKFHQSGRIDVINSQTSSPIFPSVIAVSDDYCYVGEFAKKQQRTKANDLNIIHSSKRIIGKNCNDVCKAFEKTWSLSSASEKNKDSILFVGPDYIVKKCQDRDRAAFCLKLQKKRSSEITPEETAAIILKELHKNYSLTSIRSTNKVVIGVPAMFNESQKIATRNAALLAGLDVIGLVPEPTAAALYYTHITKTHLEDNKNEIILVFDLGGGTLDVSALRRSNDEIEVIATSGNQSVGGLDIDHRLFYKANEQIYYQSQKQGLSIDLSPCQADEEISDSNTLRKIRERCYLINLVEEMKIKLGSIDRITEDVVLSNKTFKITLSTNDINGVVDDLFEDAFSNVFEDIKQQLKKRGVNKIDKVILIGGSTKIKSIQEYLQDYFNESQIISDSEIDPFTAVSQGAAIYGAILMNHKTTHLCRVKEITPMSIGILTIIDKTQKIIRDIKRGSPKNTTGLSIPFSIGNRSKLLIRCFETESDDFSTVENSYEIAHFVIDKDSDPVLSKSKGKSIYAWIYLSQNEIEVRYNITGKQKDKQYQSVRNTLDFGIFDKTIASKYINNLSVIVNEEWIVPDDLFRK